MNAQVTKKSFSCELITIRSKRSFAELISRIDTTFQQYDPKTLRDLTAEGDTEKLAAYVKQVGEPTEFAIFFSLDQGSTQRLAGMPIESRFYLFGNATIAQGLFRYSARAGLGAPVRFCVSQKDGEDARVDIDLEEAFRGGARTLSLRRPQAKPDGSLEVPIARTYPLAEVREAFRELAKRKTHGKIVLLP